MLPSKGEYGTVGERRVFEACVEWTGIGLWGKSSQGGRSAPGG